MGNKRNEWIEKRSVWKRNLENVTAYWSIHSRSKNKSICCHCLPLDLKDSFVCLWKWATSMKAHRHKRIEEKTQLKINIYLMICFISERWMVTVFMVFLHVYNHFKCWHPIVWRHLHAQRLLRIYFFLSLSILTCSMNKRLEFIMKMLGNDLMYLLLI